MDDDEFTEDDPDGGYTILAPRPLSWWLIPLRLVELVHNILQGVCATLGGIANDIARHDAHREIRRSFTEEAGLEIERITTAAKE